MLKIKDNVDLKELEKFGFEKSYSNGPSYTKRLSNGSITTGFILIKADHKINDLPIGNARELQFIKIDSDILSHEFDNMLFVIYDLIKADLVDKVEE